MELITKNKKEDRKNKGEIAEFLKLNPEALESFEKMYQSTLEHVPEDNFFDLNAKQASSILKQQVEVDVDITDRIVDELLASIGHKSAPKEYLEVKDLLHIPLEQRPQLTGRLVQKDLKENTYLMLLSHYKNWLETKNIQYYHMFRQGLDLLDLDSITYEILGMNVNSMGYWWPTVDKAVKSTSFFKVPETKIIKVPLPILQLTRLDYTQHTPATLKIVNDFCMKAFDLDVSKKYFIKTGTYSSKFDFRNALVQGEQEVRELGEYLLFIHHQALQMASPLSSPCIYGVSTTNEWVVREYIEDKENNPTIYKGMPLHTEYRVFVDFDKKRILGNSMYWRSDVMKKSFESGSSHHKKHDYIVYQMHEDVLYKRYEDNVDKVLLEIEKLIIHMDLEGQWSIDIMQNGDDFYIIDMAIAANSALNDCVPSELSEPEENWLPQLS